MMELDAILTELEREKCKKVNYAKENAQRRHNFIPLIMTLLEAMAEQGHLDQYLTQ